MPEERPHVSLARSRAVTVGRVVGIVGGNRELRGEPLIKARHAGCHVVQFRLAPLAFSTPLRTERSEVPLAEVSRGVAVLLQQLREIDFFLLEMSRVRARDAVAKWIAPGQATAAGGRTDRGARVVAIQFYAGLGHLIEMRGHDLRMAIESGVTPSQIVRHAENDVGPGSFHGERGGEESEGESEDAGDHHVGTSMSPWG